MWFIVTLVLLSFFQLGVYYTIKHPTKTAKILGVQKVNRSLVALFLVLVLLYFIILVIMVIRSHEPQPRSQQDVSVTPPVSNNMYTYLGKEQGTDIENVYYLWNSPMISKDLLTRVAKTIQATSCSHCTVHFYDTTQAYTKDHERLTITNSQVMNDWNTKYYVYVADHYLGYLTPTANANFSYYPFKDWYYWKLKNQG